MPTMRPMDDAAKQTGIGRRTLQRWISEGVITAYSITGDRRRYVDMDEIRRLREPKPIPRPTAADR